MSQLEQDSRQVAPTAEMVPQLCSAGFDASNHLAQLCVQRRHALFEAGPGSLQATFFFFASRWFLGLAGMGLRIKVLLN